MKDERRTSPPERRRFLRESLTGSVPLLIDWVAGRARALARLVQEPTVPRRTSSPPAAKDAPPAPAKAKLDEHYSEFARDNPSGDALRAGPDSDPYSPRSFPVDSRKVK